MAQEWIFRDDRVPDVEIRCAQSVTFNIWVRGELRHYYSEDGWSNTSCFTSYEDDQSYMVSHAYACAAAERHFDMIVEEMEEEEEHDNFSV